MSRKKSGTSTKPNAKHNALLGIFLVVVGSIVALIGGASMTVAVLVIVGAALLGVHVDWPTMM